MSVLAGLAAVRTFPEPTESARERSSQATWGKVQKHALLVLYSIDKELAHDLQEILDKVQERIMYEDIRRLLYEGCRAWT